jgi:hypothetical protein
LFKTFTNIQHAPSNSNERGRFQVNGLLFEKASFCAAPVLIRFRRSILDVQRFSSVMPPFINHIHNSGQHRAFIRAVNQRARSGLTNVAGLRAHCDPLVQPWILISVHSTFLSRCASLADAASRLAILSTGGKISSRASYDGGREYGAIVSVFIRINPLIRFVAGYLKGILSFIIQ